MMRFCITKNSELSVREQLVRQVILAILSEDLPPGHKIPSTRSIARRYKIHANTVSAAYHHLLEQGWLELRRGSGLYVRSARSQDELDELLARLLVDARKLGHEPEALLQRLEQLIRPRRYTKIRIVEPDPAMREILEAEIGLNSDEGSDALAVALQTRATPGSFILRLRSVPGSLEGQTRPPANAIVTIVSASQSFRLWARSILIAVGIEPDCLSDADTGIPGWQERVGNLAITDTVAAKLLPAGTMSKVFRIIAEASIAELKQMLEL
jgi:DNA-binding transcriptional regulator YhcF (GntR family)